MGKEQHGQPVEVVNTPAVTVSGGATEAKQDTANTTLAEIQAAAGPLSNSQAVAVTTDGAYAALDGIGGIISLLTVNSASGKPVILESLAVKDKNANALGLQIYFFKATPAAGTYTNNAPLVWGAGDAANCVGCISILAADWITIGGQSTVTFSGLDLHLDVDATTLFLLIAAPTGSAPTYTNGNLTLALEFTKKQ